LHLNLIFFFCLALGFEPQGQAGTPPLEPHTPRHFLVYFLGRVSHFCPGLALNVDLPTIASLIAGILNNFLPGLAWKHKLLDLCLWSSWDFTELGCKLKFLICVFVSLSWGYISWGQGPCKSLFTLVIHLPLRTSSIK
jgi:hypothetical protein